MINRASPHNAIIRLLGLGINFSPEEDNNLFVERLMKTNKTVKFITYILK